MKADLRICVSWSMQEKVGRRGLPRKETVDVGRTGWKGGKGTR